MFSLSRQFKVLPWDILDGDGELMVLLMHYLNGYARGKEIKGG